MRPSLRSDSLISVSFDWNSSLAGMHVGWIWVKHGFAISAPRAVRPPDRGDVAAPWRSSRGRRRCRSRRWRARPRAPRASCTSPVTRSRATTPTARPSFTTRSSISVRACSSTLPRCTWRASAWYAPSSSCWPVWPAGVERARHLRATERAVVEQPAVLAGERHALGDALVDDVRRSSARAGRRWPRGRGSRRP